MALDKEISQRCRVCLMHLRNIRSIRSFISQSSCEKLVLALISSRLDYANSVVNGLPTYRLNQLQRVQNIAARIVAGKRKFDRIHPILKSLHWLPVQYRIQFKILQLTFKAIHHIGPDYICELITLYQTTRSLRSSDKMLLDIPKCRTKTYGGRAFSYEAPRLWNALPTHIRREPSYTRFKRQLKTFLFNRAFSI